MEQTILEKLDHVIALLERDVDRWLTTQEFCKKYDTSPPTLRKMAREGKVEVVQLSERSPRYRMRAAG